MNGANESAVGSIVELQLVSGKTNVLNGTARYVVPLYQRAFAWGTGRKLRQNEIIQLMDDVMGYSGDSYHLGSLVVSQRGDDLFEVIDGQQRLTALFLILSRLGLVVKKDCLSYVCRSSAEMALSKIANGTFTSDDGVDVRDPACGIYAGVNAIDQKIANENARLREMGKPEDYAERLAGKFEFVVLYRVVVPEKTDLNRYFEVMNTRGEQLEQQDIVKAVLMSHLGNDEERSVFATVWDACSDMDGYCQMHFHNVDQRDAIFGCDWSDLPEFTTPKRFLEIIAEASDHGDAKNFQQLSFRELVETPVEINGVTMDDAPISRFEGIIDFPHFLLHVLQVFQSTEDGSLDDKKLIDSFKAVIPTSTTERRSFSKKFILCLLKCRCLFDRYFIKRETTNDGTDAWSLKELVQNKSGSKKSASYRGTIFSDDESDIHDELKMIQACLRVSYLDPKSMRWITRLLNAMYSSKTVSGDFLLAEAMAMAREEVKTFLGASDHACQGVATSHLVLNYLDYLLWTRHETYKVDIDGFEFEYRSSVEHWYPQHPTSAETWGEEVNRFGNLCILRGDINSKFSNLLPQSKQLNQEKYLNPKHQSLKLRIMADLTKNGQWDRKTCNVHEKTMLQLLRDDCEGL